MRSNNLSFLKSEEQTLWLLKGSWLNDANVCSVCDDADILSYFCAPLSL